MRAVSIENLFVLKHVPLSFIFTALAGSWYYEGVGDSSTVSFRPGYLEIMMRMKTVFTFVGLWCASLLQAGEAVNNPCLAPYEKLEDGPWKIRRWDQRYPFVFLSYGQWPAEDRIALECQRQSLLTPTWEDPKFAHPIESQATEWGWSAEWRPSGCTTKRECYEKVKKLYLERTRRRQYPGTKDALIKKGERFYMLSMQATYLLCGAEWGCDMVGIETGENLGASNILTVFVRGAARQTGKPFYVQPSPWHMGSVPFSSRATTIRRSTSLRRNRSTRQSHMGLVRSQTEAIPHITSRGNGIMPGWPGRPSFARKHVKPISLRATNGSVVKTPREETIPLSPIGRRAQRFLALARRHPDIGMPYTPFALLFDQYCGYTGFREQMPRPWNGLKPALPDWEIVLFFESLFPGHTEIVFTPRGCSRPTTRNTRRTYTRNASPCQRPIAKPTTPC